MKITDKSQTIRELATEHGTFVFEQNAETISLVFKDLEDVPVMIYEEKTTSKANLNQILATLANITSDNVVKIRKPRKPRKTGTVSLNPVD